VGGSVVDDDDFNLTRDVTVPADALQTRVETRGVIPDGNHEGDARFHLRGSPSVHNGDMPDGSTLNSSYIGGMLVNIRTMNVTVQTRRRARKRGGREAFSGL